MKTLIALLMLLMLLVSRSVAQPGLMGTYYAGTNFERNVLTRVDPQLDFDWARQSPAPGLPSSYYSIRWTGKILAPATGQYRFYASVDDGIRIWVGNKKIMDSWQLNDSRDFMGSIVLEAGHYYDLRIDYFNDMLGGKIKLYWQRPNARLPMPELVSARYFLQKEPVAAAPKTPVVVVNLPKSTTPDKATRPTPKPVMNRTLLRKSPAPNSLKRAAPNRTAISEPPTNIEPDTTFNLRRRIIPFEQSSYVLLPESLTELDQLVLVLKKHPGWHISVAGYTDNVGNPRLNLVLSEYRARVVANYLIGRGISGERVATTGYGDTHPITANKNEEDRRQNRRVVITRQ